MVNEIVMWFGYGVCIALIFWLVNIFYYRLTFRNVNELYAEWNAADDKYRALNDAASDIEWALKEVRATTKIITAGAFELWLIDREKEAWVEYEADTRPIKSDKHLRMSSARRNLQAWIKEFKVVDLDAVEERIVKAKADERAHVAAAITKAQLQLEEVKKVICCANPNWAEAGNLYTPLFFIGLQGMIKHSIFSKIKHFDCDDPNYVPKGIAEFRRENPIVMTEQDSKDFLG